MADDGVKEKFQMAKDDTRHFALIIVELFLVLLIVLSLFFLFDPQISFPQAEFVPLPIKLVLFFGAVALALKLYSYTKDFRVSSKEL